MRTSILVLCCKPVEHFKAAPAAGALDVVGGVGDLLQFQQHEARHDDQAFDEMRLNQVGDASVNDDAGVEQQKVVRLVLRREADVGDDERKILLVAAHGQHHADVAEAQEQAEPDELARFAVGVSKQAGMVHQQRDQPAEQQPERRGGKRAERKAFQHFVHGNEQSAEAEADDHAKDAAVLLADIFLAPG